MQSVFEPFGDLNQVLRLLADVSETEDSDVVEVEVPGVKREDIAPDGDRAGGGGRHAAPDRDHRQLGISTGRPPGDPG